MDLVHQIKGEENQTPQLVLVFMQFKTNIKVIPAGGKFLPPQPLQLLLPPPPPLQVWLF